MVTHSVMGGHVSQSNMPLFTTSGCGQDHGGSKAGIVLEETEEVCPAGRDRRVPPCGNRPAAEAWQGGAGLRRVRLNVGRLNANFGLGHDSQSAV
jgi:hypothetical protein